MSASHGDRLRGIIARASEFGDVAEMANAAVELDALLAENQQLRGALEEAEALLVPGPKLGQRARALEVVRAALAAVRVATILRGRLRRGEEVA
jgi:hypothetical protein